MPWKINGKEYGDNAGSTIYVSSKINGTIFLNYKTVNSKYLPFCYTYEITYLGMPPFDPPSEVEAANCDANGTDRYTLFDGNPSQIICCFIDSINVTSGPDIGITLFGTDGCNFY